MPRKKDTTPQRPDTIRMGRLRAYPRRPPGKRDPRWYWQVVIHERGGQRTVQGASQRGTTNEITAHLAALITERGLDAAAPNNTAPALSGNLDHLLRAWLTTQKARAERVGAGITAQSYRSYKTRVKTLCRRIGAWAPADLRRRGVLQAEVDQLAREYAARTVSGLVDVLRLAWCAGLAAGRCEGPFPALELPRIDDDSRVYSHDTPTRAQATAFLRQSDIDTAATPANRWRWKTAELLAATGARLGEVAGLDWSDVDLERGELVLRGKTGRRVVGIGPRLRRHLTAWQKEAAHPHAVIGRRPIPDKSLREAMIATGTRAGLSLRITPHGFRRMVSWRLIESGIDAVRYREIMGHTLAQGLRDYARSTPTARRAAWKLLDMGEE